MRLLRRTDSQRTKENIALRKFRLQLILDAIAKDAVPLVAVELPDCDFTGNETDRHGFVNGCDTNKEENAGADTEVPQLSERCKVSAEAAVDGSRLGDRGSGLQRDDCEGSVSSTSRGSPCEASMHSDTVAREGSVSGMSTLYQSDSSCCDLDNSPCSKGAVTQAWAAVMCGRQLKMGEQILLAHEVCEVECHKEEVGKLSCSKTVSNAANLQSLVYAANEPQDVELDKTLIDIETEEPNKIGCPATKNGMIYFENNLEQVGCAEAETISERVTYDHINQLLKKVSVQEAVVLQVSKVLDLCKSSASSTSEERVESERYLLLANQMLKALLREVDSLKNCGTECNSSISKGMLLLKDFTIPLTAEFVNAAKTEAVDFWFVCLVTHRESVVSTNATCELGSGALYFAGPVCLPDLNENFKVFLNVYSLRFKTVKLQRKRKYKVKKCKMLPSSSKFRCSKVKMLVPQSNATHSSSFTLVGSLELDASSMRRRAWPLSKVTACSPLSGMVHIKVEPSLCSVEVGRSGFLSVLEEVAGGPRLWHYQWCDLEQWTFCFWNYPSEKLLGKPALRSVDLRKCTGTVGAAPRELCSRPHAFLVETYSCEPVVRVPNCIHSDERHIFSADSKSEMEEWCALLNSVVTCIKLWNGLHV